MILARLLPKKILSQQARKPSGFIGRVIMSSVFKKGNNDLNVFVQECLALEPAHHVLEIGFGPGVLIHRMAALVPNGRVEGLDFSETMLFAATALNKKLIEAGKVSLSRGDAKQLTHAENSFDRVCAVNILYFWRPPEIYLAEILRVLKPGAHFVLGLRSSEQMDKLPLDQEVFSTYSLDEAVQLMQQVGFSEVQVRERPSAPFTSYCIIGKKSKPRHAANKRQA